MLRTRLVCHPLDVAHGLADYERIVLVTGGSSGIGKMMAAGFAQNGAKVYIASRKESELKKVRGDPLLFAVVLALTNHSFSLSRSSQK